MNNIRLTMTNNRGKRIVKDFTDPMDVIGYLYRCYAASRNAAQTKALNARLDAEYHNSLESEAAE